MKLTLGLVCAAMAMAQTPQWKSPAGRTYLSQADNADLKALQEKAGANPKDAAGQIALGAPMTGCCSSTGRFRFTAS